MIILISVVTVLIRKIGVKEQSFDNFQPSLTRHLKAFQSSTALVFIYKHERIVVLRDGRIGIPAAILVAHRHKRRVIIHGVIYRFTVVATLDTPLVADVGIDAQSHGQAVFKSCSFDITAGSEEIVADTPYNAVALDVVDRCVVISRLVSAGDRERLWLCAKPVRWVSFAQSVL